MEELDTLRGLAVLMVVVFHGFVWSFGVEGTSGFARMFLRVTQVGWLGVDLFFVLSGFLITGILLDTKRRGDYYSRFYVRRALRILPAYLATLAAVALFANPTTPFLLASLFFLANVVDLVGVPMAYGPLWSLCVEEHFYLLWPALVRALSRRALIGVSLGIVAVEPLLRLVAFHHGMHYGLYSHTWLVADGLAMGALLAALLREPGMDRPRLRRLSLGLIGTGAALFVVLAPHGILFRTNPLGAALQYTPWLLAFAGLIAAVILVGTSRWSHLVRVRPLRFFGEISYGLYLFHVLFFRGYDWLAARYAPSLADVDGRLGVMGLRFLVAGGVAVLVSVASRRYFEEYFLRLKDRWAPATRAEPLPAAMQTAA